MSDSKLSCSFCGEPQTAQTPLIAGINGHICSACVQLAGQVVSSWSKASQHKLAPKSLPKPKVIKSYLDSYIIGQDDAKETLSVAVYNHFKRFFNEPIPAKTKNLHEKDETVELEKSNVLLLGPTGSGKTLLIRTLAKMLEVPCVVADVTSLTQAGYVGDDVENVIARLVEAAEGNIALAEWGIVYLDEVDKLARKGDGSLGVRDVSGEGVQQALLKIVEGTELKLPGKGGRRDHADGQLINTTNILFIAGGAFAGIEQLVEKRLSHHQTKIGFNAKFQDADIGKKNTVMTTVTTDDLQKFGIIPEFIGRFHTLAILQQPTVDDLVHILTEPKNALVKQYQRLFDFDGLKLKFTPDALREIAGQALARGTGARGLRSVIETLLRKTMYSLPSRTDINECIVTAEFVRGESEITYLKQHDSTSAKKDIEHLPDCMRSTAGKGQCQEKLTSGSQ